LKSMFRKEIHHGVKVDNQNGSKKEVRDVFQEVRDIFHYLKNRINQRVAIACGDDFASSYGIADA